MMRNLMSRYLPTLSCNFTSALVGALTIASIQNIFVWAFFSGICGIIAFAVTDFALSKHPNFDSVHPKRQLSQTYFAYSSLVSWLTALSYTVAIELEYGVVTRAIAGMFTLQFYDLALLVGSGLVVAYVPLSVLSMLERDEIVPSHRWLVLGLGALMPLGSALLLFSSIYNNLNS